MRAAHAALLPAAVAAWDSAWKFEPQYACVVCDAVAGGAPCARYGACGTVADGVTDCVAAGHCSPEQHAALRAAPRGATAAAAPGGAPIDLRVAKGFGTKPYDQIRVSVVTAAGANVTGFDYTAPFQFAWTDNALHSKMIAHPSPGKTATLDIAGVQVPIRLPAAGAGAAGLLIADPCIKGSQMTCVYQKKFQTDARTHEMINTIMAHDDADFWGIFGDNLYDQKGALTREWFARLNLTTTAKPLLTVPGNHDYWIMGTPLLGGPNDQYANGHMQWYAQDAKSAEGDTPGIRSPHPFDFSVEPVPGKNKPSINNSFWYNQIGNIGIVGWSGAYSLDESTPLMREACAWLGAQRRAGGGDVDVAVLVGHWDVSGLGASSDMAGPGFYDHMKVLPGCDAYDSDGMLKFFMGHTHCNVPHPHGKVDTGFMVAGQGMEGCGNYGWPIIDTTEGRIRVWHFESVSKDGTDRYADQLSCIRENGWRGCTALADLWLNQTLA